MMYLLPNPKPQPLPSTGQPELDPKGNSLFLLKSTFGETVTYEEVIASGEVFSPDLVTPPIKRATAPGQQDCC